MFYIHANIQYVLKKTGSKQEQNGHMARHPKLKIPVVSVCRDRRPVARRLKTTRRSRPIVGGLTTPQAPMLL